MSGASFPPAAGGWSSAGWYAPSVVAIIVVLNSTLRSGCSSRYLVVVLGISSVKLQRLIVIFSPEDEFPEDEELSVVDGVLVEELPVDELPLLVPLLPLLQAASIDASKTMIVVRVRMRFIVNLPLYLLLYFCNRIHIIDRKSTRLN